MSRWLVIVQSDPDMDHLLAAVYRSAERGQQIEVWVTSYPTSQMRHRLRLIEPFKNVRIRLRLNPRSSDSVVHRILRLRHCRPILVRSLKRGKFTLIIHEWWDGIDEPNQPLFKRIRNYLFRQFSLQIQLAALKLRIPVVALPHGHSLKDASIASKQAQQIAINGGGRLPFQNRDSFAAYVVAHESDRKFLTEKTTMSGHNIRVWGSARFSPRWVKLLYTTSRKPMSPCAKKTPLKILFFLPKWNNSINRQETITLLSELSSTPDIELWIREHPRLGESCLTSVEQSELIGHESVVFIKREIDTIDLIQECDVIIEIESSIAIDAVLMGKRLIMPRYLQDSGVHSRFDQSSCITITKSCDETIQLLTESRKVVEPDSHFLAEIAAQLSENQLELYDDRLREVEQMYLSIP